MASLSIYKYALQVLVPKYALQVLVPKYALQVLDLFEQMNFLNFQSASDKEIFYMIVVDLYGI